MDWRRGLWKSGAEQTGGEVYGRVELRYSEGEVYGKVEQD
jgi:hypothetical protein